MTHSPHRRKVVLGSLSMLAVTAVGVVVSAGPLDPPAGPVAGTYKTLTEVEPRTLISIANTPGNTASIFRITQPGSYYLGANVIGIAGRHGIVVAASNVTIDLNGFALIGPGGNSISDAVTTESLRSQITIRNGTISNWASDGINLNAGGVGTGLVIEGVTVSGCGATGIVAGDSSVVRGCSSRLNVGAGFSLGDHAVIVECSAVDNQANGFFVGDNAAMTDCSASGNVLIGVFTGVQATIRGCTSRDNGSHGFRTGDATSLSECSARENGGSGISGGTRTSVANSAAALNAQSGFSLGSGGAVSGCTSGENGASGITIGAAGSVSGCSVILNGFTGISGGTGATVSASSSTSNGRNGISVGSGGSIIGCSAASNAEHGIYAMDNVLIQGNNCDNNGTAIEGGGGIHVDGAECRIEGNNCTGNDRGIEVDGPSNMILRNTCGRNGINFDFYNFNQYGRIVDLTVVVTGTVSGNSATSSLTTTDPWANFAYAP